MLEPTMRAACHILTCSLLAWCGLAGVAMAQDDGGSDGPAVKLDDLAPQKAMSDADRRGMEAVIKQNIESLESDDAGQVSSARQALASWSNGVATPVFRGEFSKLACQPLADLVKRASPLQAVNAIEVLRIIRTFESIKALALLGSAAESSTLNVGIRLAASRAALAGIDAGTDMNSAQAEGLVRVLTAAAKSETEWLSALSQLTALGSLANRSGMDAKVRGAALDGQVQGLQAIGVRVKQGGVATAGLLNAAYRVMNSMRLNLATAAPSERASLGKALLPVAETFQQLGNAQPKDAPAELVDTYKETSAAAKRLLDWLKPSEKPAGKPATKPATKPAGKPAAKPAPKNPTN